MQSVYSCVIFHVKHKKLPFLAVLTLFPILGKIQDAGQDGDHIPYLVKKIKGFPLKVEVHVYVSWSLRTNLVDCYKSQKGKLKIRLWQMER